MIPTKSRGTLQLCWSPTDRMEDATTYVVRWPVEGSLSMTVDKMRDRLIEILAEDHITEKAQ